MRLVYYLVSPSCVVSAERDMLVAVTTDWGITQAPHDAGQPPATRRCQPALMITAAYSWPVRSFLPVPAGLSISLGNSAHSLLLPASGELELHSLTSNLSLICKTPITAGHTMTPVQFRPNNNPIQAHKHSNTSPKPSPQRPPTRNDPFCSPQQLQKPLLLAQH